jgi:hypothetical protein
MGARQAGPLAFFDRDLTMTKSEFTKYFMRIVFLLGGTALSFIVYFACLYSFEVQVFPINVNDLSIEISIISAVIGYSFPAAFFLIALPRNGYLAELDKKKFTLPYAIVIASPALLGIVSLIFFLLYRKIVDPKNWLFHLGYAFFINTIVNFFWSFYVILRIVSIHRSKSV